MAESALRDAVAKRWGVHSSWVVESAGVAAETGLEMHPRARRALELRGIEPTAAFRSRKLSHEIVERADLILTAERAHRAAVVTLMPAAVHHTFTLLQFARMVSGVTRLEADDEPAALGRELISAAVEARSHLQPLVGRDDDVPDPIGHGKRRFRRCAAQLVGSIDAILAPLTSPE